MGALLYCLEGRGLAINGKGPLLAPRASMMVGFLMFLFTVFQVFFLLHLRCLSNDLERFEIHPERLWKPISFYILSFVQLFAITARSVIGGGSTSE